MTFEEDIEVTILDEQLILLHSSFKSGKEKASENEMEREKKERKG